MCPITVRLTSSLLTSTQERLRLFRINFEFYWSEGSALVGPITPRLLLTQSTPAPEVRPSCFQGNLEWLFDSNVS